MMVVAGHDLNLGGGLARVFGDELPGQLWRNDRIVGPYQVHLPEVAQGWTEIAGVERAGQRLYAMETGPGLVVEVAGDGDDAIDVVAPGCQQQGDGGTPGVADQLQRLGVGLLFEGIDCSVEAGDHFDGEARVGPVVATAGG